MSFELFPGAIAWVVGIVLGAINWHRLTISSRLALIALVVIAGSSFFLNSFFWLWPDLNPPLWAYRLQSFLEHFVIDPLWLIVIGVIFLPRPKRSVGPSAYAGFWRRAAAHLIDVSIASLGAMVIGLIIIGIPFYGASTQAIDRMFGIFTISPVDTLTPVRFPQFQILNPFTHFIGNILLLREFQSGEGAAPLAPYVAVCLLWFALAWLYWAGMESSAKRATFGKMLFQVVVTDLDGNRLSFERATARFVSKLVSWLILMIGFLITAFTSKKQALHDLMTRCIVVVGDGMDVQ